MYPETHIPEWQHDRLVAKNSSFLFTRIPLTAVGAKSECGGQARQDTISKQGLERRESEEGEGAGKDLFSAASRQLLLAKDPHPPLLV